LVAVLVVVGAAGVGNAGGERSMVRQDWLKWGNNNAEFNNPDGNDGKNQNCFNVLEFKKNSGRNQKLIQ
jgi:hypothetical protein